MQAEADKEVKVAEVNQGVKAKLADKQLQEELEDRANYLGGFFELIDE
jgi:hypothetical protein